MARIQTYIGLADPQAGPLAGRADHCEDEAGCRRPMAIGFPGHFMHAADTQPIREGGGLRRRSRNGPDEAPGFEGCNIHLFLFCSFLEKESIICGWRPALLVRMP